MVVRMGRTEIGRRNGPSDENFCAWRFPTSPDSRSCPSNTKPTLSTCSPMIWRLSYRYH